MSSPSTTARDPRRNGAKPGGEVEHFDVLIVGAGLSGIGAGVHLRTKCPTKSFVVLESREAIGGTWDLFRYPGIRSDSDMYTLGYSFKPWTEAKAIADGPSILNYVRETAAEHGIDERIRFNHRVTRVEWSTEEARWSVTAERNDTGEEVRLTCGFVLGCTGYYRYDQGFTPELPGIDRFEGRVVHPQHWPEDLDYAGKRVVVIGSGATAVTLVPAMAERAEHVTMLQRSPTYVISMPARDPIADFLRRVLPARLAYPLARAKNVTMQSLFYRLSRRRPQLVRRLLRRGAQQHLPEGYDVDTHFNPRYDPWDQRVCLVPDADLFEALGSGDASVVTDSIETFTESGIRLASGDELEADVVVTATGLNLVVAGGMEILVDGREFKIPEGVSYKGMMFGGVPNLVYVLGYTNASWTLKADLVLSYACRLLNHMDATGTSIAMPRSPGADFETEPIIDLMAGYVLRAIDQLPKQGHETPWRLHQNYPRDIVMLKRGPVEDEWMEFSGSPRPAPVAA
jgi:monooxygenase